MVTFDEPGLLLLLLLLLCMVASSCCSSDQFRAISKIMSFPLLKSVADARKSNKVQPIKKILSLPISDRGEGAHRIGETLDT